MQYIKSIYIKKNSHEYSTISYNHVFTIKLYFSFVENTISSLLQSSNTSLLLILIGDYLYATLQKRKRSCQIRIPLLYTTKQTNLTVSTDISSFFSPVTLKKYSSSFQKQVSPLMFCFVLLRNSVCSAFLLSWEITILHFLGSFPLTESYSSNFHFTKAKILPFSFLFHFLSLLEFYLILLNISLFFLNHLFPGFYFFHQFFEVVLKDVL